MAQYQATDVIDLSAAPDLDLNYNTATLRSEGAPVTPAFAYPIKPSDLDHGVATSGTMYTINNSGRYYVSQDLVPKFQSGKTSISTLGIAANNVTLNLNTKAIRVHPDANTSGSGHIGIKVSSSLHNITILNGHVIGSNGSTLVIDKGLSFGSSLKNVVLHDLHVSQVKVEGMVLTSVNGLKVSNSSVTNCSATAETAGFKATSCNDLDVRHCLFNNNDTTTGAAHGLYLIDCINGNFEDINASSNTSSATSSAASHGIRLATSSGGCANMVFKDVTTTNNKVTGSAGGSSYGIRLESSTKNCTFHNVDASGNGDSSNTVNAYGLHATTAESCVFKDMKLSNNDAVTSATGVHLIDCSDFSLTNVNASNNTAASAYGYRLVSSSTGCKGCNFVNCGTANNVSSAGEAAGFHVSGSPANRYQSCHAKNNSATGGQCSGWRFASSSNANHLENCVALNNSGNGAVYGFSFESVNGNKLANCHANENSSSGSDVAGMNFSGSIGNTISLCEANHNVAGSSASNAYGFSLASSSKHNHFADCHSAACSAQGANKVAAGFRANAGTNNQFLRCKSLGHFCTGTGTLSSSAIQQYGCGFLLQNGEAAATIEGCQADSNDGGAGEGVGFGVYLQGNNILTSTSDTTAPVNTTVKNCTMSFNTSTGSGGTQANKYGFFDAHRDTTSVLINNVSIGHGRCIATLNASFNFVDPVTTSDANGMNFMFRKTGSDENPTNMIHETDIFNWATLSTSVPNWMNTSVSTGQVT